MFDRRRMRETGARYQRRGSALLEAMVAFLVLSSGMLAVARLQSQLRLGADVSRQRAEAVRLAQEDIETVRAFAALNAAPPLAAFDDIATASRQVNAQTGHASQTDYRVSRQVDATPAGPRAKVVTVTVAWTDLAGAAQQVRLKSIIAGTDPAFGGALSLARSNEVATGVQARSIRVPLAAKDLGDGRSAFKPVAGGSAAVVLDNASGRVTGRCQVASALATSDLTPAALGACDAAAGLLLSGVVRFSSASPPDPAQANEPPLPLSISVAIAGPLPAAPPWCAAEAVKTVAYDTHGRHWADVPLAAAPAALGLAGWTETGDRHVRYHCVVYPSATGVWSGRAEIAPSGWTLGIGPGDHRACRYSSDLDGSGTIDGNIEHPADYRGVGAALAHQNFLVIRGDQPCPLAPPVRIAGQPSDVYADLSTLPHPP